MTYTYNNKGTCSVRTVVELNDDHTIKSVQVLGGCDGNLKGIAKLLPGMKAEDAIARMEGTTCGRKPTSCPDQIAQALKGALAGNLTAAEAKKAIKEATPINGRSNPFIRTKILERLFGDFLF